MPNKVVSGLLNYVQHTGEWELHNPALWAREVSTRATGSPSESRDAPFHPIIRETP